MRLLALLTIVSLLIGCDPRATGPLPIAPDDACASCRMLISQRRYAAELLDSDGTIYKFDDIACMLRFAHAHNRTSPSVRFYVSEDASGRSWIDARRAWYVRLENSNSSPMGSGLVAFSDAEEALHAAGPSAHKFRFGDLWQHEGGRNTAPSGGLQTGKANHGY